MAPRSKVALLPPEVREALEQRLIGSGFSGYEEHSAWLAEQGYEIKKSSVHRFGSTFEDRCAGLAIATTQAKAIVEASGDDEGAMGRSLTSLLQKKIFDALLDLEIDPDEIDISKLGRMIADLSRASVTQQKHASQVRKDSREELQREQSANLDKVAAEQGMTGDQVKFWRERFLGIAG